MRVQRVFPLMRALMTLISSMLYISCSEDVRHQRKDVVKAAPAARCSQLTAIECPKVYRFLGELETIIATVSNISNTLDSSRFIYNSSQSSREQSRVSSKRKMTKTTDNTRNLREQSWIWSRSPRDWQSRMEVSPGGSFTFQSALRESEILQLKIISDRHGIAGNEI